MFKNARTYLLFLGIVAPLCASADDDSQSLAKFKGGIGVIPVSSAPGPALIAATVNRNIVRGVQPPGQIWVIEDLRADVKADGSIRVDGRGLLLGGGNGIGGNANQSVFATLICEAAAPFVEHSTSRIADRWRATLLETGFTLLDRLRRDRQANTQDSDTPVIHRAAAPQSLVSIGGIRLRPPVCARSRDRVHAAGLRTSGLHQL